MKSTRLLLMLALILMSTSHLWADISIVDFQNGRPQNASQQRVMDHAGNFCALIKIKTDVIGLMADATQTREKKGNTQLQSVYLVESQCDAHPDEVWVYLSSGAKRLRLLHPVYGGMKEGSSYVRSGYYYLPFSVQPEMIYTMQIRCEEAVTPVLSTSPQLSTLVDARFGCEDDGVRMYLDGSRVHSGKSYLVPAGEHAFKARRLFHDSYRQRVVATYGQPLDLSASLSHLPVNVFGGIELSKPTAYSDLAYGVRVGVECGFGLYVSYLTTISHTADGEDVRLENLQYEPLPPYADPHCQYRHWNVGLLLNCYASWHLYAGVGQAVRSVNWMGLDGKRHELRSDRYSGLAMEAGVMYNVNRFYLSAGADYVDGSFGGRMGVGIFLNLLK